MENEIGKEVLARADVTRPTLVLPEGFALDDIEQPDYSRPLAETAAPIIEQNITFADEARANGFAPVRKLEYSQNGALVYITDLFDAIAQYEEGRVPKRVLGPMEETTEKLIDALEALADAPMTELEVARVAFHKANRFWHRHYLRPRMLREVYLKKLFDARDEICRALEALHLAYVARATAHPVRKTVAREKRRGPAAARKEKNPQRADDLRRVFQEIDAKRKQSWSLLKTLQWMRQSDVWHARLGRMKNETIRRYYYAHTRH